MKSLLGVFLSFIGFYLLIKLSETEDPLTFQISAIFSIPLIYFGLKLLVFG